MWGEKDKLWEKRRPPRWQSSYSALIGLNYYREHNIILGDFTAVSQSFFLSLFSISTAQSKGDVLSEAPRGVIKHSCVCRQCWNDWKVFVEKVRLYCAEQVQVMNLQNEVKEDRWKIPTGQMIFLLVSRIQLSHFFTSQLISIGDSLNYLDWLLIDKR